MEKNHDMGAALCWAEKPGASVLPAGILEGDTMAGPHGDALMAELQGATLEGAPDSPAETPPSTLSHLPAIHLTTTVSGRHIHGPHCRVEETRLHPLGQAVAVGLRGPGPASPPSHCLGNRNPVH